jgi:hypothetical protein
MEVKLVININGVKEISLTEEQARELQAKLNSIFVQPEPYTGIRTWDPNHKYVSSLTMD